KEIEAAAARHPLEHPVVVEVAERPLGIAHIDAPRRVERDARGEALAEHAEPDDQIGDDEVGLALADPRADAPRQELGIALDIGDQREKLLRRIGEHPLLGMGRHRAKILSRHPVRLQPTGLSRGESGGPGATARRGPWIPAFAGMTMINANWPLSPKTCSRRD